MASAFGCPECGEVLVGQGAAPGRRVRCGACGTLVEIPFLARGAMPRSGSRTRTPGAILAAAGVLVAVVMIVVAVFVAKGRGQAARVREVSDAVARSESAEQAGRFHDAVAEVEAALKIARKHLEPTARKPLETLRNRLALREAEADLSASVLVPDQVATLRGLRERVALDPALEPIRYRVIAAMTTALAARAEADLREASRAAAAGQSEMAISLCEGVARIADELGFERAGGVREAARAIAAQVVARSGVVVAPITGTFLPGLGSARAHEAKLGPALADLLRRKGYLPKPEKTAFADAWDEVAPYRLAVEVVERVEGTFFQTPLQTSRVSGYLALYEGPKIIWEARPYGKTRLPPPDMGAFELSRLSMAKERDPDVEKRLYQDARSLFMESLGNALRTLPPIKVAG